MSKAIELLPTEQELLENITNSGHLRTGMCDCCAREKRDNAAYEAAFARMSTTELFAVCVKAGYSGPEMRRKDSVSWLHERGVTFLTGG